MGPIAWWTSKWRSSDRFQDVATALGTFAAGLALNLLGLTHMYSDFRAVEAPAWAPTALLALGCVAMLFKRRHPILALCAGVVIAVADALLGGSVAMVLVLFDLLFSAGQFASARGRTAVMTGVVVVIGTASVVTGLALADLRASVFVALQLTGLFVVPLWWAANIRQQRELGRLNAERARHEAIDAERASMARELHDVIASHLSTTAIHSAAALALPADPERDRAALRAVRQSSLAALEEMRSMITLLRTDTTSAAASGIERLPELVASARATGLEVVLENPVPLEVPALVGQAGYRIVSEALANARKHSPGSRVVVSVTSVVDGLEIEVSNPLTVPDGGSLGHGALSAGTGLVSMAERAELLGGSVTAGPSDGLWVVRAHVPFLP
ncbi:MAG TPA: histidine kinase [Candidatus Limnocylindrales bacterium]|nr:histidine kinase [Candidatus Limnocylindrales bacterium]